MKIYDISQEVFSCEVYPGDPAPEKKVLKSMQEGEVRYSLSDGSIDEIDINKEEQSLLMDVFTYQDKSIYITARFKGSILGLNLGFYTADGIYVKGVGTFDMIEYGYPTQRFAISPKNQEDIK